MWQMTATEAQLMDLEFYMQKTFCKTASLMANSAKSIAVLSGQPRMVGEGGEGEEGGCLMYYRRGHQRCCLPPWLYNSCGGKGERGRGEKRGPGKASLLGGGQASY